MQKNAQGVDNHVNLFVSMEHSDIIRQSIEKLFAEDFEPLWMTQQRDINRQNWLERLNLCKVKGRRSRRPRIRRVVTDPIEIAYRRSAEESHRRIMAKCKGVYYSN